MPAPLAVATARPAQDKAPAITTVPADAKDFSPGGLPDTAYDDKPARQEVRDDDTKEPKLRL